AMTTSKAKGEGARNQMQVTTVNGGYIKREARTGRFVEVQSERGKAIASAITESTINRVLN
ncbi:MAG: hypothetical protein WBC93_01395, partial [Sulfitobacter sp.]